MKATSVPRSATIAVCFAAVGASLVATWSYEFSIPALGASGFAISLVPHFGDVVLAASPNNALWFYLGDEWGGAPTHLRHLVATSGLHVLGTLAVLAILSHHRRFPKIAAALGAVHLLVPAMCVASELAQVNIPAIFFDYLWSSTIIVAILLCWLVYSIAAQRPSTKA